MVRVSSAGFILGARGDATAGSIAWLAWNSRCACDRGEVAREVGRACQECAQDPILSPIGIWYASSPASSGAVVVVLRGL